MGKEDKPGSSLYNFLRYYIVPPLFLVVFTLVTQVLVVLGNPNLMLDQAFLWKFYTGLFSPFAWKVVCLFYLWAYLSLVEPLGKTFKGPPTPGSGYVPVYKANGTQFYLISVIVFLGLVYKYPYLCNDIYEDFHSIVAVLNATSMMLCLYLLVNGIISPQEESDKGQIKKYPIPYLFYRGVELHPRILGVDIKQWSICRVGMLGWALLPIVFSVLSVNLHGFNEGSWGIIVNCVLINIYLLKFFWWETGYFLTLDIIFDRAGYYLCWGCLTWVQAFYSFSTYYMVAHPSKLSSIQSLGVFLFGILSIVLNYYTDYQRELFRATNGNCLIWGKRPEFLEVEYKDHKGNWKRSKLLLSGMWRPARHLNYLFEIMLSLSWSLPAVHYGITPFYYFIFIIFLLTHRCIRDEEKCLAKYGKGWEMYCKRVPYRMIPGIF